MVIINKNLVCFIVSDGYWNYIDYEEFRYK